MSQSNHTNQMQQPRLCDLRLMADPEDLAKLTGLDINPTAFDLYPQGRRILVVLDPVPEKAGLIDLPEEYRSREKMGAGTVMAVGPEVGQPAPFPGGPHCTPSHLLYQHVVFGMHSGNILRLDIMDRDYYSGIIIMTDRDIWAVDSGLYTNETEQEAE